MERDMEVSGAPRAIGARGLLLTAVALFAFAGNSLLCRLALRPGLLDPATFALVRVVSGAAILALIVRLQGGGRAGAADGRRSALMLVAYMVLFSFAYVSLGAGTGALILFGAVQLTMLIGAWREGERFTLASWIGLVIAAGGLIYLVAPGVSAPNPLGAALMAIAGIAWGLYSLFGRGALDPLRATSRNFLYSIPLVVVVSLLFSHGLHVSPQGLALAIASGAITSGAGYVIWYAALAHLTRTEASVVQLSVPIIAAFGGVFLLSEPVTGRMLVATGATLGGVAIALAQRNSAPSL